MFQSMKKRLKMLKRESKSIEFKDKKKLSKNKMS